MHILLIIWLQNSQSAAANAKYFLPAILTVIVFSLSLSDSCSLTIRKNHINIWMLAACPLKALLLGY